METEEEERSKPLEPPLALENDPTAITAANLAEDRDPNKAPEWESEPPPPQGADSRDTRIFGGVSESKATTPPETEEMTSDERADQVAVAGYAELQSCQSPPPLSPQVAVAERVEDGAAAAEEVNQGIELPKLPEEVDEKEARNEDLISGKESRGVVEHNNLFFEDANNGIERVTLEEKTESDRPIVDEVEQETGMGGVEGLKMTKEMKKIDQEKETKSDVAGIGMGEGMVTGVGSELTDAAEEMKEDAGMGEERRIGVLAEGNDSAEEPIMADELEKMKNTDVGEEKKDEDADVVRGGDTKEELEEAKMEKMEVAYASDKMEVAEQGEMDADVARGDDRKEEAEEAKAENMEVVDMPDKIEVAEQGEMNNIALKTESLEERQEAFGEVGKLAEQSEMDGIAQKTEALEERHEVFEKVGHVVDQTEKTEIGEEMEKADKEENGETNEMEMVDVAKEEDVKLGGTGEEMGIAEEAEKANEAEEIEMAEGIEGADEEVEDTDTNASGPGKRKRGKNVKSPAKVPSKKKMEEDVCFICFDGGNLVLCDRRGCPKAYHPACVNRDEAFFQAKGRWNCGWHLCSSCGKNAYYMCYTCTFSLCKGCTKDAVIYCVRGNKGFCETCMRTVTLIERNEQGSREMGQVDFDDKGSWEYLFKDYWIDLKEQLSLTSEELAQAKNPWKGPDLHAGKQESLHELYDAHTDGGSGSDGSENAEVTTSKKRKPKKRMKSRAREADPRSMATGNGAEWATTDESIQWASKELLEFVMHMKNGDKSTCSQFDVQALLLEYIKQNKLRDPRRKSQIICDSRLESLFGKPRVGHFEMLKLLESHFLLKEDSHADDFQGSSVDTEANQLEADGNSDAIIKPSKDRRRKSRKRNDGRGLRSNLDDYAAIDMHNISLIYLKRSLVENLIEDAETFHDKVVGAFVRIRISGNAQKQDLYRLVQVLGTTKAAAPYRVGKRMTDFLFEILNLNKTEVVTIDIISNQEFTEDECKRLRQSIKCGLINCLTVGDIQEKAMALQAVRVEDSLETEITRLSHLRDRASDLGRRKEECVEKLQLLKSPEERQRRLDEIPEIHADPHMDPSYESEEDEGDAVDKRHENYMRPRGSNLGRRGLEPISPRKGGFASNDSWSITRSYSGMSRDLSRSMSGKGFLNNMEDVRTGELVNEKLLGQGTDNEAHQTQNWEKQKSSPDSQSHGTQSAIKSEAAPNAMLEISPSPVSTKSAQSGVKVNETEKIWHYKDPSGKIQGPFSLLQLRKWSNTGYFPADLRIWRINEKQEDSILLTEALNGNFQKEPPSVDNSFPKTQLVHSPHFSSLSKESWKPLSEMGNSTVRAAAASLEVTNNSSDGWASEANLPSPTPVQTTVGGTKRQAHQSRWSPANIQPTVSLLEANPFSRGNGEFSHTSVPSPSSPKSIGHADGTNMSHGVSLVPKPEAGILLGNANLPQIRSLPTVPDSPRQVNSSMPSATSRGSTSINAAIDMKSLQNLVQPVTTSTPVGAHAWVSGLVSKTEMNTTNVVPGSGSQAWGIAPSQKPEPNNSMSMSTQPSVYGNWGEAPTSIHNSSSSSNTGNQTGVSPVPGTSSFLPSDTWRTPVPGQSNIQPTVQSNVPWGMGSTGNQNPTLRQGPESQNTSWGTLSGNPNMGWGGLVPANSNLSWAAPHGQAPANPNPVWAVPVQGQGSGNANAGRAAPMQGHAAGNSVASWVPPGQASAPVNVSTAWAVPGQGPPPVNVKPSWVAPSGNMGAWQTERDQNVDRTSSQRDGGSQGADSGYGGAKSWNRQSSFNRGEPSRPSFKGQRVCKFHENGHCKKGASCDYLHT